MHNRYSSLVYEIASLLDAGYGEWSLEFLDWNEAEVRNDFLKFGKSSLIRKIAKCYLIEEFRRDFRKNPEAWEGERLGALESDLRFCGIKVQKFTAYCRKMRTQDEEDALVTWWDDHEDGFLALYERYSREVEHLLFSNRHFLLRVHLALAALLRERGLNLIGRAIPLPRIAIPRWVKNAAYCRDHGRCVFCNADLSGIINLQAEEHFDHMVPLAIGGTNDPTNIQLLCKRCNLRKSKKPATAYRYMDWWKDDETSPG